MIAPRPVRVSFGIVKPTDARNPLSASLIVSVDGVGRVDLTLTEHELAHFLGGTSQKVSGFFVPEDVTP